MEKIFSINQKLLCSPTAILDVELEMRIFFGGLLVDHYCKVSVVIEEKIEI
jgi:hypothetical protein